MAIRSINSIVHRAQRLQVTYGYSNKQIYCFELSTIYDDVEEASNATKAEKRAIINCCLKKQGTTNNLHFCFVEDKDVYVQIKKGAKPIICVNTGVIYGSIQDACAATGCNKTQVSLCCNGHIETTHGLTWAFYEEGVQLKTKEVRIKKIYQYDKTTGDFISEFASGAEAADALNLPRKKSSNITSVAGGRRPSAYGYRWSYIKADNYFDIKN